MLFRGKHTGLFLYELTPSDLLGDKQGNVRYQVGNVLLFASKKQVVLGAELVKADDLAAAYEFLASEAAQTGDVYAENTSEESLYSLKQQLLQSEANLKQRDDLLHDLAADLESQRYSNTVLIAQLEALREQISIEQITREEVIGDLEIASLETYQKDKELQKAIEAKTQLEQELAARICELLELDSANVDLQKRLEQGTTPSPDKAPEAAAEASTAGSAPQLQKEYDGALPPEAKILTMTNGKQIHLYHEFSSAREGRRTGALSRITIVARTAFIVVLSVILILAGSIVATALFNGMSPGDALDTLLSTLTP